MKRLAKSTVVLATALLSTAALATNGDNLIGQGPVTRGMGGLGIGMAVETDSIFKNPAWISEYEGTIVSFGGTLFMPNVKANIKTMMTAGGPVSTNGDVKSQADTFLVPEIALIKRVGENLTFGLGAFGVSGLGADYRNKIVDPTKRNASPLAHVNTLFQYLSFVPSISYNTNGFYLGAGLNIAYGMLSIGMRDNTNKQLGGGPSSDIGTGYIIGAGYKLGIFTIGLNYQSEVAMTYERVFDFDGNGLYDDQKLNQPAEYGIGIGIDLGSLRVGADWKQVKWSKADGYKEFGWDDQDVIAIGAEFKAGRTTLRLGYNHGNSPIKNLNYDEASLPPSADEEKLMNLSYMNLIGFPAIAEDAYTLGLGYTFTGGFSLDFAYTYVPEATITHKYSTKTTPSQTLLDVTAKNQQDAFTVAFRYNF